MRHLQKIGFALFLTGSILSASAPDPGVAQAAMRDDKTLVVSLLRKGFAVDAPQGDGSTALHWAALNDDIEIARVLLRSHADVKATTRNERFTPLHLAAEGASSALIQLLLKAGSDPNAITTSGATPLMKAAASGNASAVATLIEAGANINAAELKRNETALMFAAGKDRADVIRLLLAKGADPGAATAVVKLQRRRVDEDGNPIPDTARPGRKPALGGTATSAVAKVTGGLTALEIAARDGSFRAVSALIEGGADVNQLGQGDKSSPLVIAICNGHYDLAKYLLEQKADPNLATVDGLTPLYATEDTEYAEMGWAPNPVTNQENISYIDLLKLLLAHGAQPNSKLLRPLWFRPTSHQEEWVSKQGVTAFWRAAMAADVNAMKILLAGGADPSLKSAEGVTPLMVAAGLGWAANASRTVVNGSLPAVRFLLDLNADVNTNDIYNYTALHGAAYRGDNAVVELLLEHGARLDVKSKRGQLAADMANGPMVNAHLPIDHPETVALLEKHGSAPPAVPQAGAPSNASIALDTK